MALYMSFDVHAWVLWMESWTAFVNVGRDLLESVGVVHLGIRVGKLACGLWAAGRDHE